ncbi:DUF397 domain-containing protein [Actinokineospora inagensis]|uniref:DUF397 domain-containing protein n=1 Tax=Actinokineospora inagensis TaxID=103730 RepID=UPI0012F9AE7B|nr:DUF397 domain-containing protein [Actinokineospora inagensis]
MSTNRVSTSRVSGRFRRSSRCTTGACVELLITTSRLHVRGTAPDRELVFPAAARARLVRAVRAGSLTG